MLHSVQMEWASFQAWLLLEDNRLIATNQAVYWIRREIRQNLPTTTQHTGYNKWSFLNEKSTHKKINWKPGILKQNFDLARITKFSDVWEQLTDQTIGEGFGFLKPEILLEDN